MKQILDNIKQVMLAILYFIGSAVLIGMAGYGASHVYSNYQDLQHQANEVREEIVEDVTKQE